MEYLILTLFSSLFIGYILKVEPKKKWFYKLLSVHIGLKPKEYEKVSFYHVKCAILSLAISLAILLLLFFSMFLGFYFAVSDTMIFVIIFMFPVGVLLSFAKFVEHSIKALQGRGRIFISPLRKKEKSMLNNIFYDSRLTKHPN